MTLFKQSPFGGIICLDLIMGKVGQNHVLWLVVSSFPLDLQMKQPGGKVPFLPEDGGGAAGFPAGLVLAGPFLPEK